MDGEDEATKEAAAPAGDDEDEALDFSKKKKKVRPSPLPAPSLCAPTGACARPNECATCRGFAEEAQGR